MIAAVGGGRLSILGLVLIALIGAALAAIIAWPILRPGPDEGDGEGAARRPDGRADDLERALASIRLLEAERAAGDIAESDFRILVEAERARAVALMREIEESPTPPHPPGG